jgi:predicted AlkP superfamily pyrophosphatase or phosphodiesterase
MKRNISLFLTGATMAFGIVSGQPVERTLSRPKLVVGIMVDQMRWDFLYRFHDRYGEDGLKRMLREGFACENTFIPYAQTVTAAGHACVYTGSVPAINGIMGNDWYDRSLGRTVYCAEDSTVKTIGGSPRALPMSPRNLLTTSITDELRLATNFRSKVIGIAIKDRGGILPAGHSANAAYWYDGSTGNWVTSTYYMSDLPAWARAFNARKLPDSLFRLDWNTLYPLSTYVQSDADNRPWEGRSVSDTAPSFPHRLSGLVGKNYGLIAATPHGNTLTLEFAKAALLSEGLGVDGVTDLLAVSLSSPDYIGHQYGPNSVEVEDNYLRMDRELAAFFRFLDDKVGRGQYLCFLTADHAVAHVPGYLEANRIPAKTLAPSQSAIDQALTARFGIRDLVLSADNYQLYLDYRKVDSAGLDRVAFRKAAVEALNRESDILLAFDCADISAANLPSAVRERFLQGYHTKRGGDIQIVLKPHYFFGGRTGTTHGSWYPYDAHIPLLWMGWGVKPGHTHRETYMTDIAPTLAALLRVQMPSGAIGKVIGEVMAR